MDDPVRTKRVVKLGPDLTIPEKVREELIKLANSKFKSILEPEYFDETGDGYNSCIHIMKVMKKLDRWDELAPKRF